MLRFLILVGGMLAGLTGTYGAERIPVETFARGAEMRSPAISPSGKLLVYIAHQQGKHLIVVRDLVARSEKAILLGEINDFLVQNCWFKTDDRLVCHFLGTAFEFGDPYAVTRLLAVNADGSKIKVLVQNGAAGVSQFQDRILHRLPDDPEHVLVQLDDDGNVFPAVFKLNVYNGNLSHIVREREPVLHWFADRDGAVRFGYGYTDATKKGIYMARDSGDGDWRVLDRFARFDNEHWRVAGFSVTKDSLLVLSNHNGRDALFEMNLDDQSDQQLLFSDSSYDIDGPEEWPTDGRLIGVSYETDRPQIELFDPAAAALLRGVNAALPNKINRLVSASRDSKRLIFVSYSDVQAPRYFLMDVTAGRLTEIGQENSALRDKALAPMRTVKIPVAGGLMMQGYLTIPPDSSGKNLPTVVLPHGGPYSRDSWHFDELLQMLVSRGYAVLQMNYRGSTGFGQAWLDAGFQGWGTVMHDDITSGARWALKEGIADPKRMCIVGWSYGGYAALIGAVKEPDLYRCAVSIAGVTDLAKLRFQQSRFYGGGQAARNAIGSENLEAQSPRRRAAEIKVPVLLVHGTSDIQVRFEHGREMDKALSREHKPHEFIVIKGGDHSLTMPAMRTTLFQALERFLAQNMGP